MAATYHHARRLYIGTTAERAAVVLDVDGIGTDYWDTDVGVLYIWDGTAWVAGFAALPHDILSATHDDTTPAVVVRGDLMTGQGVAPLWARLARGNAHEIFKMDAASTDPGWEPFDWDEMAGVAGADMVHDHSVAAEGDHVPIMSLGNYAQRRMIRGGAVDWETFIAAVAGEAIVSTGIAPTFTLTPTWQGLHTFSAAARTTRLGVGTPIPSLDNVIATAEQAADPAFVAGVGAWLARNDAGEAKPFFVTDSGAPIEQSFELAEIVEVTVTVGAAGDFATIQAAVDWFKGRIVLGACVIDVDAGTYDEAVIFEDILITPGSSLTLEGDTRTLAGLSYVDGSIANRAGLANGGTFNNANRCTLTVNAGGDQITVSGGTVDPDFDDGVTGVWGDGDWVLVFGNDDTIYEREVNAILGVNDNIIELKVALPGAAFPGGGGALDDGSAVCLCPDRAIDRTVAGNCIQCIGVNLTVDGFYLETHTGAQCNGVRVQNGALVILKSVAINAEDYGVWGNASYSIVQAIDGAFSIWGASRGVYVVTSAEALTLYTCAVACAAGMYTDQFAVISAGASIATHCTNGFQSRRYSFINAAACGARQNTRGYLAEYTGYIYAASTIANNNGNITDYTPNPGGVGSAQDANFATIYSS